MPVLARSFSVPETILPSLAIVDMLNRLGVSKDVEPKTVFQPGAEQSMASVADGKVEMAFALVSEILPASGVQFAGPLPVEFQRPIVMSAGIASSTNNRASGEAIIKWLTSRAAANTIKSAGMDPIAREK